jgi:hypothetical protein
MGLHKVRKVISLIQVILMYFSHAADINSGKEESTVELGYDEHSVITKDF